MSEYHRNLLVFVHLGVVERGQGVELRVAIRPVLVGCGIVRDLEVAFWHVDLDMENCCTALQRSSPGGVSGLPGGQLRKNHSFSPGGADVAFGWTSGRMKRPPRPPGMCGGDRGSIDTGTPRDGRDGWYHDKSLQLGVALVAHVKIVLLLVCIGVVVERRGKVPAKVVLGE